MMFYSSGCSIISTVALSKNAFFDGFDQQIPQIPHFLRLTFEEHFLRLVLRLCFVMLR